MLGLFIDIETCPVYREVFAAALRHSLDLYVVTRDYVALGPNAYLIVTEADAEAARTWIAANIGRGDICITADAALAARCVRRGAKALRPSGRSWTEPGVTPGDRSSRLETDAVTGAFVERDTQRFTARLEAAIAVASVTPRSGASAFDVVPGSPHERTAETALPFTVV